MNSNVWGKLWSKQSPQLNCIVNAAQRIGSGRMSDFAKDTQDFCGRMAKAQFIDCLAELVFQGAGKKCCADFIGVI